MDGDIVTAVGLVYPNSPSQARTIPQPPAEQPVRNPFKREPAIMFRSPTSVSVLLRWTFVVVACLSLIAFSGIPHQANAQEFEDPDLQRGAVIYREQCASCHGTNGEGVADKYSKPLVGDESVGQLTKTIADTMPEEDPDLCVGEDAASVSAFIHHAFYSEAAQLRNRPPRITLARLTANQLRQSLSDLYARSSGLPSIQEGTGIKAIYFNGSRWKDENKKIQRVDPVINFDFGLDSPGEGISAEEFYIYWEGGLKVNTTGTYEIVVRSTVSFTMDFGRNGRRFIDNHVQSGDKTEFRETIHLTAGRIYPIKIDYIQRKRLTQRPPASISLSWIPPGGTEHIIPTENLVPSGVPATFALQANLPADDRSYGYDRGIAINRQWDDSTTNAAIEFAGIAAEELWPQFERRNRDQPNENRALMRRFLSEVGRTAFRGQWNDNLQKAYVDATIDSVEDDRDAIRRSVLMILKSPRFLYPTLDPSASPSQQAATRLALVLHDSLPIDNGLLQQVEKGELETPDQIRRAAMRMVNDYRTRAKTREMIHEWLTLNNASELSKDPNQYPDFDAAVTTDLRRSFDAFIDEIVWSEASDYRQFFLADWNWTTPRLTAVYGDDRQAFIGEPEEKTSDETMLAGEEIPAASSTESDTVAAAGGDAALGDNVNSSTQETNAEESPGSQDGTDAEIVSTNADSTNSNANTVFETSALVRAPISKDHRYGLLTHPLLMSHLAYHDSSSPIHRGVFVIRYLLGRTLRPPMDAFSPLSPDLHPDLTTRERVTLQTSPDSCMVCHEKINSLGFAMENFDAIGRYRIEERGKTIDTTSKYVDRHGNEVQLSSPAELADYLATSDDAHEAFVSRVFQYFVKQPIAAYGPNRLAELTASFRENGYNVRQLIVDVAVVAATERESFESEESSDENAAL